MQQIEFKKEHDSIKFFDPISLGKFSIITGKNGSGKTHFLKGIHEGKFKATIDGQTLSRIGYFDYNEFKQQIATQNKTNNTAAQNQENEIFGAQLLNIKNDFEQLVSKKISDGLSYEQMKQFERFKYYYVDVHNPNLFTPEKWPSLEEVINHVMGSDVIPEVKLWNEFFELLNEVIVELDRKYKDSRWYLVAKQKGVGLPSLNASAFGSKESGLVKLLQEIFQQYFSHKYEFQHNLTTRKVGGDDVDFDFEIENFHRLNKAPWLFLNEILKEYGQSDYSFEEADLLPSGSRPPYNVNISLRNKNGALVHVEKLSSGEQTLFALAASLFAEKTSGSLPELLLLDEIDASLHPSMCKQLLDVLRNAFVEQQQVKIIMVTHSPSTIAHAEDGETYVMSVSEGGKKHCVTKEGKEKALEALTDGFVSLSEGLKFLSDLQDNEITIFTEGKNTEYIKKALDLREPELSHSVSVINGIEGKSGKDQLKVLFDFFTRLRHEGRAFFVWDCDVNEYRALRDSEDTHPFVIENNASNNLSKKGIENLFPESLIQDFNDNHGGRGDGFFHNDDKKLFCDFVLTRNNPDDFRNFQPLFDKIKEDFNSETET